MAARRGRDGARHGVGVVTGPGRGVFHWLSSLVRNLTRGDRSDAELDANVQSYVDLLTDEKVAGGMPPDQARRAALIEAGGIESTKEETRRVRAGAWVAEISRDVRYALRLARHAPAFSITAVLTLGLGIGANIAVFSVVNGVLLGRLPYDAPDRIVKFQNHDAQNEFGVSERERLIYADESSIFEVFATYSFGAVNMTGAGDAERLTGAIVDAGVFDVIGVHAMRGRLFTPSDASGGPGTVAVLTEGFWARRFARDESLVGRSVTLNGRPRTVVGILPAGVRLPGDFTGSPVEVYLPLVFSGPPNPENIHYLDAVARIKEGVSLEQAGTRLRVRATEVRQEISQLPETYSVRLIPVDEVVLGDVRPGLLAVSAAVALLLLIACGNLAGLLLARSQQRAAELTLRSALGASRGRLLRQMMTESVLLAIVGGGLGAVLATLGTRLLVALGPNLPRAEEIGVDGWALVFAAGLAMATGVLFGLAPALVQARRDGPATMAAGTGRGSNAGVSLGARRSLIAGQVALSVMLGIGAGLLARSVAALAAVPTGFDPSGVLTMRVTLPAASYPNLASSRRFLDDALRKIRSVPGVIEAGATTHLPLASGMGDWGLMIDGLPERDENGRRPNADWSAVSSGYFEAMGIRVVEGRTYGAGDVAGAPLVTIISERMAREYFPGRSAIGRRMRMSSTIDPVYREIIGVVADVHHEGLDQPPARQMYLPLAQFPTGQDTGGGTRSIVVKSQGDPTLPTSAIRARLRESDPDAPVALVQTMREIVDGSTSVSRLYLVMVGLFSGLAIAIVSVGIYGVASYLVATRRRELAVRRALGATSGAVVRLVVREGAMPALAGAVVGVMGALAMSGLVNNLLFGVTSRDPLVFVLVPAIITALAVAANLLPARGAIRENPTMALRN